MAGCYACFPKIDFARGQIQNPLFENRLNDEMDECKAMTANSCVSQ